MCMAHLATTKLVENPVSLSIANPRNYKSRSQTPSPVQYIILIMRLKTKKWLSMSSGIPAIERYISVAFPSLSLQTWTLLFFFFLIKIKMFNFSQDCKTLSCYESITCQDCHCNFTANFISQRQHRTTLSCGAVVSWLLPHLLPRPASGNKQWPLNGEWSKDTPQPFQIQEKKCWFPQGHTVCWELLV